MVMRRILIAMFALLCAVPAGAQDAEDSTPVLTGETRFMLGGALSLDNAAIESFASDDFADRGDIVSTDADRFNVGTDLYAGLDVDGIINLRMGLRDFGSMEADISPAGFSGGNERGDLEVEASGRYVALDVLFPLAGLANFGLTAGLYDWHGEKTVNTTSTLRVERLGATDPFYGLKARRIFGDFAVQVSLDRYKLSTDAGNDLDIVAAGAGVEYRF
jgi:hypothetical protein